MNIFLYIILFSIVLSNQSPLLDKYHTYEEVQQRLLDWNDLYGNTDNPQPNYYSDSGIIYKLEEIGYSNVNQLPIYAVKLSYNADQDLDKPKVLILGQCHAEEIYGVEISMALIEMFLDPSLIGSSDHQYLPSISEVIPAIHLRNILSKIEIWVVPTHNPDGLQIVHGYEDSNGLWIQDVSYRKNLTDTNSNGVFDYVSYLFDLNAGNDLDGVDLNRNYDFHFDNSLYLSGGSGDLHIEDEYDGSGGYGEYRSSYDYYRGSHAFSESETAAIRDLALDKNFLLSIAYHSSRSGRVSEKVIYSWDWEGAGKPSPDINAIESIGDNIASLIDTQDPDLNPDLEYYKKVRASRRKGQAHDWFYARTGCFQYLIEMGPGGDEGIQTSSDSFYDEVIRNNFKGLFYLLNRSLGTHNSVEQYGVTGVVTDADTGLPIQDVIYQVDEIYTNILDPRKTDEFGRYRWLLSDNDNSTHISFRHWDYEPLTFQEFDITSSSITNLDIQLTKREQYTQQINLSGSEDALLVLENDYDGSNLIDSLYLSQGTNAIQLHSGISKLQISSDGYCPVVIGREDLEALEELSLNVNLNQCVKYSLNILSDQDLYQEGDIYGNNLNICRSYNFPNGFGDVPFIHFNMGYELEWDKDSLIITPPTSVNGAYMGNNSLHYTDQSWDSKDYYIDLPGLEVSPDDPYVTVDDGELKLCLVSDESLGYKGVKINEVNALYGSSDFTLSNNIIIPNKISLEQNYPNPFNPDTQISFSMSEPSLVSLSVYNIKGNLVDKIIDNEYYNSGKFSISYRPEKLSSGIYFYKINDGQNIITKKMIYLK